MTSRVPECQGYASKANGEGAFVVTLLGLVKSGIICTMDARMITGKGKG